MGTIKFPKPRGTRFPSHLFFHTFCPYQESLCALLCVRSSIAIILMGKRELVALLNLSSWCLVMVERLFLAVPQGCLQFVIVVFPDHTHYFYLFSWEKRASIIFVCTSQGQKSRVEVKYIHKRVYFGTKDYTKELKLECAYFLGQTS